MCDLLDYVFHLKVLINIAGIDEWIDERDIHVRADTYQSAELLARQKFVKMHTLLHGFTDFHRIQVCDYDFK